MLVHGIQFASKAAKSLTGLRFCRYEKLSEKILSWEDKKRKKAKRKLHRTEVPLPFFHSFLGPKN